MKLEKGELKIEIQDILDHMTDTQKRWLFRHAAFSDEAIKGVVDFLAEGLAYTNCEDCIAPEDGVDYQPDCWWLDNETQIRITEAIAPRLSEVAAELVATLKTQLEHHRHCHHEYRKALWTLEGWWEEARRQRVEVNVTDYKQMTKEEAAEWIRKLETKLEETE
jgi:hypothetical protein